MGEFEFLICHLPVVIHFFFACCFLEDMYYCGECVVSCVFFSYDDCCGWGVHVDGLVFDCVGVCRVRTPSVVQARSGINGERCECRHGRHYCCVSHRDRYDVCVRPAASENSRELRPVILSLLNAQVVDKLDR